MKTYTNIKTLSQYKNLGKTESYSIQASTYLDKYENIIIQSNLIYDKYDSIIMSMTKLKTLSEEELNKYKYKPDLLSYDIYGTPMLSHLILYVNRCSEFEFCKKDIRLIPSEYITEIFDYIMAHETDIMRKYNSNIVG